MRLNSADDKKDETSNLHDDADLAKLESLLI